MYPDTVQRLVDALRDLPGIGQRTAERLAFHLLTVPQDRAMKLAYAIRDAKKAIRACSVCCQPTEGETCAICLDPKRDPATICVVEQPKDLYAIEKIGAFRGVYHVLLGALALLDGVEAKDLTIDRLEARLSQGAVREVILATNPNLDGDATALYLTRLLAERKGLRVTRIARGIAAGSVLESASRAILEDALENRRQA